MSLTLLVVMVLLLVAGSVVIYAFKRMKKPSEAVTEVEPKIPALEVLKYKREVQAIIDHYRKMIKNKQLNSGCSALAMHVIGKVEDVTLDLDQQDTKQYLNSLTIRLEAFRAAYQGEPSYTFNCDGSKSIEFSNTLINAIFNYLQKSQGDL